MMCTWIRLLACAVIRIRVIGSTISLAYDFFEQKTTKSVAERLHPLSNVNLESPKDELLTHVDFPLL